MYKEFIELQDILKEILGNAPYEELCSDEENDMYADMQNLIESIEIFLESEGI